MSRFASCVLLAELVVLLHACSGAACILLQELTNAAKLAGCQ